MSGLSPNFEAVVEEIHLLSCISGLPCTGFRHEEVGASVFVTDSTDPQVLLEYTVPKDFCWIVSRISLATIPPVDDPTLTAGDWRSEYLDAIGDGKLWIVVNDKPKTITSAVYFILSNRPVLFLFNGGAKVQLVIQRLAADPPPTERALISVHSFLAPAKAYDRLAPFETQVIATFVPTPP